MTAVGAIVFIATRNFGVILAASAVGTISRGDGGGGGARMNGAGEDRERRSPPTA